MSRLKRIAPYLVASGLGALLIYRGSVETGHRRVFTLFEDSMISMRYARNLAEGHGLAWNPGGPAVEGYTNPLWTLYMALLHLLRLPAAAVIVGVAVTGIALALVAAWASGELAESLSPGSRPAAVWAVALCYPLLYWGALGTEVALVAAAILLACVSLDRWAAAGSQVQLGLAALCLFVAIWAREDAAALALPLAAFAGLVGRRRVTGLVVIGGACVLALAGLTLFQLGLYDQALPNTYYLKVNGIGPGTRLHRGLDDLLTAYSLGLWAPLGAALAYVVSLGRRMRPLGVLLACLFLVQCAYDAWVGGDTYDLIAGPGRMVAVVLPELLVLAVCFASSLASSARPARRRAFTVGAAAVVVGAALNISGVHPVFGGRFAEMTARSLGWRLIGPALLAVALLVWWRRRAAVTAALLTGAMIFAFTGFDVVEALAYGPSAANIAVAFDGQRARFALDLRSALRPGAVLASGAVGEVGYFDPGRLVDLLGFTDAHIAREHPATGRFLPGHDKWDLAYSLTRWHPDLVLEWDSSRRSDVAILRRLGYGPVPPSAAIGYLDELTLHVDRAALERVYARCGGAC